MPIVTGSALGISGTVTTTGDAFAVEIPFSVSYQGGVGFTDVTRISDTSRRKTYSLVLPGTVFLSAWWDDSLGSESPHIPVGQELSSLTVTLASGKSFGTDTGGTAIINQQSIVARKGAGKQLVQYTIRFSGPVTPAFGPAFSINPAPGAADKIIYELYDGNRSVFGRTQSSARRLFHYVGHQPSDLSDSIIRSFIAVNPASNVNTVIDGTTLTIGSSYSATAPNLLVESIRVVERINPNESKIEVAYRDFQFNFGSAAIVNRTSLSSRQATIDIPIITKIVDSLGAVTEWTPTVKAVSVGEVVISESIKAIGLQSSGAIIRSLVIADNIGKLFRIPASGGQTAVPILFKGGTVTPTGGDDYLVTYYYLARSAFPSVTADQLIGVDVTIPLVPPFGELIVVSSPGSGGAGPPSAPVYKIITADKLHLKAAAALPGSAMVIQP